MTRRPWQPGAPEIVRFHHAKSNETRLAGDRDLVRGQSGRLVLAGADDLARYAEARAAAAEAAEAAEKAAKAARKAAERARTAETSKTANEISRDGL